MEDKATFTSAQLEANDIAIDSLIELVQSGDAILMVGAGCSGGLYPAWNEFIDKMEALAIETDSKFQADKGNFLVFADKVKGCLGNDKYYSFIYETFKPKEPTHLPFHVALCRLPFKAITTTNYDFVLEHALTDVTHKPGNSLHFEGTTKNKINEFLRSLNFNKTSNRFIVHLHGVYDSPDSIVLGGTEYSTKYGFELGDNEESFLDQLSEEPMSQERLKDLLVKFGYEWPLRRKLLWSLLATRRIIFLGFSMSDPYFIKMLDFVREDLSTYNSETHFLVLRVTPTSMQRSMDHATHLKREYGIQTVFFQEDEGKYNGLGQFVAELENRVGRGVKDELKPRIVAIEEPSSGNKEMTERLFDISRKQYTDED